ncbi:MAG: hypothetical protein WC506_00345 [Candidatus Micrarchaeia archaeon]
MANLTQTAWRESQQAGTMPDENGKAHVLQPSQANPVFLVCAMIVPMRHTTPPMPAHHVSEAKG